MENQRLAAAGTVARGAIWALLALVGAAAGATVTTFTNKGAFVAATGGAFLTVEGFEFGTVGPLLLPATFPSGLSVDLASGDFNASVVDLPTGYGYTNTTLGGKNVLAFEGNGDYTVAFSVPLSNAFGFDLSGFQPVHFGSGGFHASFLRNGAQVDDVFVVDETDFTVDFRGFTSDGIFDEVRIWIMSGFSTEEAGDFVAFDEVVFAAFQTTPSPLTASFTATCPFGICIFEVGQAIPFTDQSQGNPTTWSYDWDGDGVFEDAGRVTPRTSHTYFSPGTYSPRLRVARDGDTSEYTHGSITIQGSLQARFAATCPPGPECDFIAGSAVPFVDQSLGNPTSWSYDWDGDGSFEDANLATPRTSHTYLAPGVVSPRLRVARDGQTAEFTHGAITIQPAPPLEVHIGPEEGFVSPEVEPEAPRVIIGPDGGMAVVWYQLGPSGTIICVQFFDAEGNPLTEPLQVNQFPGDNQTPTAAFDDQGNLLILWNREEGSAVFDGDRRGLGAAQGSSVVFRRFDKNGLPLSNEGVVSSGAPGESAIPESDSDLSGNSVVVWQDGGKVRARLLDPQGNPRGPAFDVNAGVTGAQPSLALSASGDFVIAWQGQSGGGPAIFARRYRDDGVVKGGEVVSAAGSPAHPAVAIDDAGNFVVVWDADGPSGRDIFTQRYAANGSRRGEIRQANASHSGDQTRPRVDINAKGRFAVVWESTEGAPANAASIQGQSVLGRVFSPQGEPEGIEVEIATAEADTTPEKPDVSVNEKDDIAVVYERRGAGGRSAGIFRKAIDVTAPPSECVADDTTLCLNDGRFRVTALWEEPSNREVNSGQAVALTGDTGYFWFFDADNVEVVVKALGACPINGRFWVFAAGLTNLEVTLRVDDVLTGQSNTYFNERSEAFLPILDSDAFATCDAASLPAVALSKGEIAALRAEVLAGLSSLVGGGDAARMLATPNTIAEEASALCATDGDSLCLSANRFQVEVQFLTSGGQGGSGQATKLTNDTGYFWFFDPNNVEIVVKVLNACSISNRIWFFAAGLTDVEAVINVIDTNTGTRREYENRQGTAFVPILDTNAFATCP
jgi:PKD repeat protein